MLSSLDFEQAMDTDRTNIQHVLLVVVTTINDCLAVLLIRLCLMLYVSSLYKYRTASIVERGDRCAAASQITVVVVFILSLYLNWPSLSCSHACLALDNLSRRGVGYLASV